MTRDLERKGGDKRHSREDLLEAGLNLLAAESIQQLTIDALCKRLGVTKGSFYHHFKNRADFLEQMLEYWVVNWTSSSIEYADKGVDARERFDLIVEASHNLPSGTETSIRSWALRDPFAQKFLDRVDNTRIEYLRSIFEEVSRDPERAAIVAKISYSIFVGIRMMGPKITKEEHRDILRMMKQELYGMIDA